MRKLLVSWQNYSTCEDCAAHLKRDVWNTISYILARLFIYPSLDPYPVCWWLWIFLYLYAVADHLFMLCYPRSPPLPVWLYITWKLFSEGSTRASVEFYKWKQRQENDPIDSKLYHNHGDSLAEISQRAKDKRNKKKEQKYKIEM